MITNKCENLVAQELCFSLKKYICLRNCTTVQETGQRCGKLVAAVTVTQLFFSSLGTKKSELGTLHVASGCALQM